MAWPLYAVYVLKAALYHIKMYKYYIFIKILNNKGPLIMQQHY